MLLVAAIAFVFTPERPGSDSARCELDLIA